MSHKYLYCSIPLDIFSFGSSEVSQCPPPCPSQLLDSSFKKLRYFQFQKSPIAMDRARSLYRGREISRRLIQSVSLDVCGVPEVAAGGQFPELLQPELCCAAGTTVLPELLHPELLAVLPSRAEPLPFEGVSSPAIRASISLIVERVSSRPPASTHSSSPCFLTSTPGRSFAHVP